MLTHPQIDPIAIKLGPLEVHWYGLAYAFAFICFYYLAKFRANNHSSYKRFWNEKIINDFIFYAILGVIIGGRFGYVLFYDFASFIKNPLSLFFIWQGGMSFHGGLIGVLIIIYLFAKNKNKSFLAISDFICPLIPPGLFFGRIANFINSELWGKPTDLPWAMIAPWGQYEPVARHPSQLYQAFFEGIILFVVIWLFSNKNRPVGAVSGLFIFLYGIFRFLVEFARLPDAHIGYLLGTSWLTMGQVLSLPMIIFGLILFFHSYLKK